MTLNLPQAEVTCQ